MQLGLNSNFFMNLILPLSRKQNTVRSPAESKNKQVPIYMSWLVQQLSTLGYLGSGYGKGIQQLSPHAGQQHARPGSHSSQPVCKGMRW